MTGSLSRGLFVAEPAGEISSGAFYWWRAGACRGMRGSAGAGFLRLLVMLVLVRDFGQSRAVLSRALLVD